MLSNVYKFLITSNIHYTANKYNASDNLHRFPHVQESVRNVCIHGSVTSITSEVTTSAALLQIAIPENKNISYHLQTGEYNPHE
jgi:hypothetical protein